MLHRIVLVMVTVAACGVGASAVDSSAVIFNDTRIHAYELQFYYPNWADSLKYYKSLPDEEYIPARFVYRKGPGDSIVFDSIGVRYKGNSSYTFAANSRKKPFKFRFDKYVDDRRFFGVTRLNFGNGAKDPTMMREKIAYDIIGAYMPAPRTAFATITIEGRLIGLYTQIEQVDKTFLKRHYAKTNGNLFKSSDNGSNLLYKDQNQSSYEDSYELKTNETANDWTSFIGMIDNLNNSSAADFTRLAGGCLALDNICRYLAFNMVFSNFDSYTGSGRNFYFYDDSSAGKFTLIPWDLNLSFGVYSNNWNVTTVDVVAVSNLSQRPLNRRILENDSLRRVYLEYIRGMVGGPANEDSIAAMADRWKPFIDSLVRADSNKLHSYEDFVKNIDSNVIVMDGLSRSTVPGLKLFSRTRNAVLRTQVAAYLPVINPGKGSAVRYGVMPVYRRGPLMIARYVISGPASPVRLEMIHCRGVVVRSCIAAGKRTGAGEIAVDTRGLGAGTYLLKLTTDSGTMSTRVMLVQP
ncbi:MAG: CotH kinase family protein [Chitinispirillaceae bacterium]|nr:CotH kinase family protein [Chitinispirillaceae bacterium]